MKFLQAKALVIKALSEGRVHVEARETQAEKNLLAIGKIDPDEAILIIQATRGDQAKSSPHHKDKSILVWVFRPQGWYIKFYFLEDCWFISFHRPDE
jgi:hypothetical protein